VEAETLFFSEMAVGVGHDGEIWVDSDHHSFRKKIRAIPAVLARRVDGKEFSVDLGSRWAQDLMRGHKLRNGVVHSSAGETTPRVSKGELISSVKAVRDYFAELGSSLPKSFAHASALFEARDPLALG
jgi:hypothetical protein